jgi:hypothetical protein
MKTMIVPLKRGYVVQPTVAIARSAVDCNLVYPHRKLAASHARERGENLYRITVILRIEEEKP